MFPFIFPPLILLIRVFLTLVLSVSKAKTEKERQGYQKPWRSFSVLALGRNTNGETGLKKIGVRPMSIW